MKYTTTALVDAIQYDGDNYDAIVKWCDELTDHTTGASSPAGSRTLALSIHSGYEIRMLELRVGHWLIRDVTGYFFTSDPVHFKNTYKPVEETQ